MLTDSFDNLTPLIILPSSFYPNRALPGTKTAILSFSSLILTQML